MLPVYRAGLSRSAALVVAMFPIATTSVFVRQSFTDPQSRNCMTVRYPLGNSRPVEGRSRGVSRVFHTANLITIPSQCEDKSFLATRRRYCRNAH